MSISERARATGPVAEMPAHEQSLAEKYRLCAEEWADADAAYYLLDNTRTSVVGELVLAEMAKGLTGSKAEHVARASTEYREHVEKTAAAKKQAGILRARMEYLKMRFSIWNSHDANARRERQMGRQAT